MNLETLLSVAVDFYHRYTLLVAVLAVGFVVLAWRNPKETFKFVIFLIIMATVLYFIGLFGDTVETGTGHKSKALHKTERVEQ